MKHSNVDFAKEQISYAVQLLFDKAPISVVATLVFSAYGILIDLLKDKDCFRDWMQKNIEPKKQKYLWADWNNEWGFFKHAKSGIGYKQIDVDFEKSIKTILFTAIHDFQLLPEKLNEAQLPKSSLEMDIYQLWFYAVYEELLICDASKDILNTAKTIFSNIENLDQAAQLDFGKRIILDLKRNIATNSP